MGRLPAHYARQVAGGEFPEPSVMAARGWRRRLINHSGRALQASRGCSGRVAGRLVWPGASRRTGPCQRCAIRVGRSLPGPRLRSQGVCERHLLYDRHCHRRRSMEVRGPPSGIPTTAFGGDRFQAHRRGFCARLACCRCRCWTPGAQVDLVRHWSEHGAETRVQLSGDFSARFGTDGSGRRSSISLPWHIADSPGMEIEVCWACCWSWRWPWLRASLVGIRKPS